MAMPNFLELSRLKSIFGNMGQPSPTFPGGVPPSPIPMDEIPRPDIPEQNPFDPAARMREIYQPETVATEKFNKLAASYPEFEKPGGWRRVGGAALGALTDLGTNFGGNRTGIKGTGVFDEFTGKNKWREDVENWEKQITPAQQAANLERQENVNARTLAHNTVQNEITSRRNESTARNQEAQNRIRQQRADAYDYRVRNPNLQFNFDGPRVRILNPANGQITETSWESKDFTPQEKMELGQKQALERIKATGAEARSTEETRQGNREDLQDKRAWTAVNRINPETGQQESMLLNTITGETKPLGMGPLTKPSSGGGGAGGLLPTQQRVETFNRAERLLNERPELRKFIKLNPNDKTVEISPAAPAQSFAGYETKPAFTADQRAEAEEYIYGTGQQQRPTTQFPSSGPTGGRGGGPGGNQGGPQKRFTTTNPPPAPKGWKYVPNPKTGGWTPVPDTGR